MIADRERLLVRRTPEGKFAHDRAALLHHFAGKLAVLRRIKAVDARTQHADRHASGHQRAMMRFAVNAEGESRDNAPSCLAEIKGEIASKTKSVRRRATRPDHRDHRFRKRLHVALHVEAEWCARRLAELPRIIRIRRRHDLDAILLRLLEFTLPVDFTARARHLLWVRLPRRDHASRARHEF